MNIKDDDIGVLDPEDQRALFDCLKDIKQSQKSGEDMDEMFTKLERKYGLEVLKQAMSALSGGLGETLTTLGELSSDISRVISHAGDWNGEELEKEDDFYNGCRRVYESLSKDDSTRTLPIIFLLNKADKKVGIAPIVGLPDRASPIDVLKPIVHKAKPYAYMFCAEVTDSEKGKLIVLLGNSMARDNKVVNVYSIDEDKDGKIEKWVDMPLHEVEENVEEAKRMML